MRNQIATSLVDQLYANVDVGAALEQQLPEDQKGLSGLIASGLREFSDRAAQRSCEDRACQEVWVDTVAFSHQQLLNVLEDDVRGTTTENGAVFLDLDRSSSSSGSASRSSRGSRSSSRTTPAGSRSSRPTSSRPRRI